jgi:hypothetical protein
MIDGKMERQFQKELMAPLKPVPLPYLPGEEPAITEDNVEGLHLGPGGAEPPVGDAVAGEEGVFSGIVRKCRQVGGNSAKLKKVKGKNNQK